MLVSQPRIKTLPSNVSGWRVVSGSLRKRRAVPRRRGLRSRRAWTSSGRAIPSLLRDSTVALYIPAAQSPPWQGSSPAKTRVSARPSRAHGHHPRPSTNGETLSDLCSTTPSCRANMSRLILSCARSILERHEDAFPKPLPEDCFCASRALGACTRDSGTPALAYRLGTFRTAENRPQEGR
jgi:hypothetical protein